MEGVPPKSVPGVELNRRQRGGVSGGLATQRIGIEYLWYRKMVVSLDGIDRR